MANYQGGDLGCSMSSARTSRLSSNQGDLGESGKGISIEEGIVIYNSLLYRIICLCVLLFVLLERGCGKNNSLKYYIFLVSGV